MACYMALLMQLAAKPEVLRVSPIHKAVSNAAVASAVVQSAKLTETPLLDAGLDGRGEVIQARRWRCDKRIRRESGGCLNMPKYPSGIPSTPRVDEHG